MNSDYPAFVYAMVPIERTSFKNFFDTGSIRRLLENPGQLRNAGWDLTTSGQARIVKGEYLEVKSAERKLLRLYEDGMFLVKVSAAEDFLSWGQSETNFKQSPRLNPLAIVEVTLNFVNLCQQLVGHLSPVPATVDLKVEVRNAFFDKTKLYLTPYGILSEAAFAYNVERRYAPEQSMRREIRVSTEDLKLWPAAIGYSLLEKIYTWFGFAPDKIPYVNSRNGVRFIDEELVKNPRSQ
jgi:hypothetical protein